MFASNTTTEHNQWTRHVLKTHDKSKPVPRCAFMSLKQKKSLEDLFFTLDAMIDAEDATTVTSPKPNQEPELQEQGSPSTRIPRQFHHAVSPRLQRKRPSLEIPTDLSPSSLKRRRATPAPAPAQKIQKGDVVKVVQGAKMKFLGLTGEVEKFLFQKRKWGIMLENGSRIALGDDCLEVVEAKPRTAAAKVPTTLHRAKTTAKCGSPEEAKRAEPKLMRARSSINSIGSLGSLSSGGCSDLLIAPRGSTSLALPCIPDLQSILPASEEELVRFTKSFPKECRPKNDIQVMIAACVTGRQDVIVSLVVNSKVDVNAESTKVNNEGLLHVTISNDQPEVCLLLMQMGIEVDHQDASGRSPLMLASERGMASVVAALCLSGANVNETNNRKQTPLMVAAMRGHLEIVDILLENDADIEMQDDMSKNALAKAMTSDDPVHRRVVDRLIQRMYDNSKKQASNGGGL